MRAIALLVVAACGGQPLLANAPHPNNAAVAGIAAGAAAAITLASPGYSPVKPERKVPDQPIEVHEQVTPDVLDRLDHNDTSGVANGSTSTDPTPVPASKPKGKSAKPPHVPLPSEAIKTDDNAPLP
jgi:hypothetical protein